jgi:hypothetical protein
MDFKGALWELMLGRSGRLPDTFGGSEILVFAVGSALMGLIAVLLDLVVFSVRGRSFFNLSYGGRITNTMRLVCLWGIGAGVGGFLGAAASVFLVTRGACIGVGVGWPLILPRLIDSFAREEDQQTPEDEQDGSS